MPRNSIPFLIFVLCGIFADANAQPLAAPARGELLYENHCIACHNTEMHWRDKKLAKDWKTLRAEVRRWQRFSGLRWSNDEVTAVARYLNTLYYHYPAPE